MHFPRSPHPKPTPELLAIDFLDVTRRDQKPKMKKAASMAAYLVFFQYAREDSNL
jgi:hypothetical protein